MVRVKTDCRTVTAWGKGYKVTMARCPFCGTVIKYYDYCDRDGFHVRGRWVGIRKCPHFIAFRGGYAIFENPPPFFPSQTLGPGPRGEGAGPRPPDPSTPLGSEGWEHPAPRGEKTGGGRNGGHV